MTPQWTTEASYLAGAAAILSGVPQLWQAARHGLPKLERVDWEQVFCVALRLVSNSLWVAVGLGLANPGLTISCAVQAVLQALLAFALMKAGRGSSQKSPRRQAPATTS